MCGQTEKPLSSPFAWSWKGRQRLLEVQLPESALWHVGGDGVALVLRVIAHEVLGARSDALRLQPLDVGHRQPCGEVRVLREGKYSHRVHHPAGFRVR